jgi:EAL domain-containing protein (putative c-di-GMP-specific phosphodiesterase class I)
MRDPGKARCCLAGLRSLGVRVALDDFGTGYSSLSYLDSLPADIIKLDRSFLNRKHGGVTSSRAVLESVIEMAHRLGLDVVGEGVETPEQANCLRRLQCDELQGFYFGEAVPAASVMKLLDARETPHPDWVGAGI